MKVHWLLVLAFAACAHIEPPPGGPQDTIPPALLLTRPDTFAVVPNFSGPAALVFEDRLSERGVEEAVFISPLTSAPNVEHRGNEIRASLRRGWERGRIYQITLLPGLQDLWNNQLGQATTLVFSTGPAIPNTRVAGIVLDRLTGKPEVGTRVDAVLRPDSLVYSTATDSSGAFTFRWIPEGRYGIRAYRDINRNRAPDLYEANDTAAVTLRAGATDSAAIRLAILPGDTTPPAVASARVADSVSIELQFDDYLDPAQTLGPTQVRITGPGGQSVTVASTRIGGAETQATDTAAANAPAAPLPSQTLSVRLMGPLAPGAEYRIRVDRVRNVRGLTGGGETTLRTPAARPARS